MWLRAALILSFAGLLPGCATDPISASAAKSVSAENRFRYADQSADTVAVTIVRDPAMILDWSGCAARVLVNDEVAAHVGNGEKVTLHIPPGEYVLGADINTGGRCCCLGLVEVEANLQLGKPRSFRIVRDGGGALGIYRTVDR